MIIENRFTCKKDRMLMLHLANVAAIVGSLHGVRPKKLRHINSFTRGVCWGYCHFNKDIEISIRRKNFNRKWRSYRLPMDEILDILAHELAHIRYFNHKDKFWKFYEKLLKEVKLWNFLLEKPLNLFEKTNKRRALKYLKAGISLGG